MNKLKVFVPSAIAQAKFVHEKLKEINAFPNTPSHISVLEPISQKNPSSIIQVFSEHVAKVPIILHSPILDMQHAANMQRFNNKIQVRYSEKLNYCWARYLICKELSHLLIDDTSDEPGHSRLTASFEDALNLIDELISCPVELSDQTRADITAYYAAVELLIPSEWVPKILNVREKASQIPGLRNQENKQIATALRVPEKILEARLDNPNVLSFFEI